MPIPTAELRAAIVTVATPAIEKFLAKHQGERFNAFAFDCNAAYGDIIACFNTEDHYEKCLGGHPARYAGKKSPWTEEEAKELYRWNTGDWAYQGFFDCHPTPQVASIISDIEEELDEEEGQQAFLDAVCEALLDLRKAKAFAAVPNGSELSLLCIDHEESSAQAFERMKRLDPDQK